LYVTVYHKVHYVTQMYNYIYYKLNKLILKIVIHFNVEVCGLGESMQQESIGSYRLLNVKHLAMGVIAPCEGIEKTNYIILKLKNIYY